MNATRTPWVERWVATACAACLGSPRALAQAAEETIKIAGQASLPHDLSPWGMFLGADAVVKGVLVGLVAASVVTWTVALVKAIELTAARLALARSRAAVERAGDLHAAVQSLERNRGAVRELAAAASDEIRRSGLDLSADGIKERIALRLQRIENADSRRLGRGAGVLATIGAVGPFVGLFGTVWGIMNSFIGISKAQTTNLAVVAPGIAEALLATAIGLAAAIPAVVVYNVLSRALAAHRAALADIATDILRTAGRDLDRHHAALRQRSPGSSDRLAAE